MLFKCFGGGGGVFRVPEKAGRGNFQTDKQKNPPGVKPPNPARSATDILGQD